MKAFNTLRNRIEKFSFTFSDKQKNLVIISRDAEQSMTATHVQKSTYERACLVVQAINTNTLTYTGADGSTWPSSLSFIPTLLTGEKVWGDWDTQEGISEILMLRLEYYLTEILSFPLPPDILADFLSWLPPHAKMPKRNIWGRDLGTPDLPKRSSYTGTLMNTSVKTHKDMLDIPPYYKSRNINRASISELTPMANFMKRMSQQLIAEQRKLWAHEDFPIVRDSLHVTRRIAYLNTYIHTCLTTIQDLPEEGEVQSFRIKNDTVLILVAADIVDMYMSITKQFVLSFHSACQSGKTHPRHTGQKSSRSLSIDIYATGYLFARKFLYLHACR